MNIFKAGANIYKVYSTQPTTSCSVNCYMLIPTMTMAFEKYVPTTEHITAIPIIFVEIYFDQN